ncbi:MAG: prepilin-type N-terminal cleavage/methylation domain-containing protein [Limisphaerales bacterium]
MNSPLKIHPSKTAGAFTLIEVMVSIAIFAILIAAVYSTWVVILKSSQVGQMAAARVQRERIAIRTLEDSLTCIQSFQASMGYYTFNVTNGQQPGLSFVARLPDIFPRNGKFDANLRRLTFSVESTGTGMDSERDLVLRQNPILMDQDADEQQVPLVLARNVKDFVIECWDTNSYDWMDGWDSTNSLPPMVRITLTLTLGDKDNNNNSPASLFTATREIAIPSNTLPTVAQTGSPNGGGGGGGIGNGGGRNNGRGGNGPGGNGQGGKNNGGRNGQGGYQPGGGPPGGFGNQSGNPR